MLNSDQVRSSIARWLGMDVGGLAHLWFVTIHPFADGGERSASYSLKDDEAEA